MDTLTRSNRNIVSNCHYHVVWCPKYRRKVLVNGIDARLKVLLQENVEKWGQEFVECEVMPDHVHFIIHLEGNVDKPATLGQVIGAYKSITTVAWLRHIEATSMNCSGLFWQDNYYERVLRDKQELEEKREYTCNNPLKLKKAPKTDEL